MCFLICSKVLSALTLDVRFSMTPSSHFWRHSLCSYLFKEKYVSSRAGVPNLFGTRDQCHGRQFFHRLGVWGWFQDDSSTLCLLCTLFLVWCHHLIWQEIPECSPEGGNPCSRSLCNSQLGAWSGSGQEMDGLGGSWYSRLKVSKIPFTHMQVNLANKIISIVTHLQISNQSI